MCAAKLTYATNSTQRRREMLTKKPRRSRPRYSRRELACAFALLALATGTALVAHTHRVGTCPLCNKFYKRLDRHIKIHYQIRAHSCPVCARAFTQGIHLQRHLQSKHSPQCARVTCAICSKKLSRKDKLIDHMRCKHPGVCD